MNRLFTSILFTVIIVFVISGCNSKPSDNPVSNQSNDMGNLTKPSSELHKELALARASTAKYHDIENAIEDGYVDINVVVQNMGYHLLNFSNWDAFDPGKPALLVYSKNSVNGKMRLVAVEYAVPNTGQAPEGFAGNDDVWEYDGDIDKWECHAWVWYNNPDGMFSKYNPRVQVDEADVNHP